MNCFVYRSNKKTGLYLYLKEKDNFNEVPNTLIKMLGDMDFSFEFDLAKNRKLVRAEASEVLRLMKENGYFLQMPPPKNEEPNPESVASLRHSTQAIDSSQV